MGHDWIQSYAGKLVRPLALTPDMVCIRDIAHALANKCRYTGQCSEFYSVAQHSLLGSLYVAHADALTFLLHDSTESYLPDIASPLKPFVFAERAGVRVAWADLEREHARVIGQALGIPDLAEKIDQPAIIRMDRAMLVMEMRDLLGPPPAERWPAGAMPPPPTTQAIQPMSPVEAEHHFLDRYWQLTCEAKRQP